MAAPLTPDLLIRAYSVGLFPMAESRRDPTLYWIDPEQRGVLPLDAFHVPRKLKRLIRRAPFDIRVDTAFREVIEGCATPAPGREDTWINTEIVRVYGVLHRMGCAHSVECWADDRLVGGLYGVALGGAFFGESMFSRATNASKVALVHLVARLIKGGFQLLDAQFVNDHLKQFGAHEIPREAYRAQLGAALRISATLPHDVSPSELETLFLHMAGRAAVSRGSAPGWCPRSP